jgi:hypothetical protein
LLKKPPAALAGRPASKSNEHQRPLDSEPESPRKLNFSPAELRPAPWRLPDDVAVSDLAYFRRHPGARHRFRLTNRCEFSRVVIVIATVERDAVGRPISISRDLYRYEGGHA